MNICLNFKYKENFIKRLNKIIETYEIEKNSSF